MSFGLKNVGATYQRLVTKMFKPLLGRTMEVHIDDTLVKSKQRSDHVTHLQEAFDLFMAYDIKLNPLKCAFGVSIGRFLGFMVTQRGIEANPSQLKTILNLPASGTRKKVQWVTGWLAALGLFIDHLKPFFATLRGVNRARWNEECDQALVAIKRYLAESFVLVSPEVGKKLFI